MLVKYVDIDLKFAPTGNKDLPTVTNEDAINKAIHNILFYRKGEKPFLKGFAVGVDDIIFSNVTNIDIIDFKTTISNNLAVLENRIKVLDIDIKRLDNELSINITYKIINGEVFPYNLVLKS